VTEDYRDAWEEHATEVDPSEVEADDDEVVCRVCGAKLGQVTPQHLELHDLTLSEYRSEYPDARVVPPGDDRSRKGGVDEHSEETKKKISEAISDLHKEGRY